MWEENKQIGYQYYIAYETREDQFISVGYTDRIFHPEWYSKVQVQVQNFIQKTFSGYTQVAYEKKEEQ